MARRANSEDEARRYQYALKFSDPPSQEELAAMEKWSFGKDARNVAEKYDVLISDEERARRINDLLQKYVVPSFEAFTTETSVLEMAKDVKHPLHATMFSGILDLVQNRNG
jgi:hypothetical protein